MSIGVVWAPTPPPPVIFRTDFMANLVTAKLRRQMKRTAITGGLEVSLLLKSLGLMKDAAGLGAIFTLHHVRPYQPKSFEPNRHLEISPEFLDSAIVRLKAEGIEFVSLQEVPQRLSAADANRRRFVTFTLDDGNNNNFEHALPVFERHGVPFTVFIAKGLSEATHSMWWETLAVLIGGLDRVAFDFGSGMRQFSLIGGEAKQWAFDRFAAYIHRGDEAGAVAAVDRLAREHGIEPLDIVRSLIMDRSRLEQLAAHPLATLGAHTVSHRAMARLDDAAAQSEIDQSILYIKDITGTSPAAIAYPYGTRATVSNRDALLAEECRLSIGVTTQPGTIDAATGSRQMLLPRISLNGFYQKPRYAAALASGIPIRLLGRKA